MIELYDTDKKFPVYTFGAKVEGKLEHCYPLNGNYEKPELLGVQGIIDEYRRGLGKYEFSEPTYFSKIIDTAAK